MIRSTTIIFPIIILFYVTALFADDYKIQVEGNENTQTSYIEQLTSRCIEKQNLVDSGDIDKKDLKICLLNSKLFSAINIELQEKTIKINVNERWTLIPIPIVSTETGGETSYGLFLMESNFLGFGKKLALGATVSKSDKMYFLMYEDPSLFGSNWLMKTQLGTQKSKMHLYEGEDKIDGIKQEAIFFNISMGYTFNHEWSGYLLYKQNEFKYEVLEDYKLPEDYNATSVGFGGKWDRSEFKFYYQDGISIRFEASQQIERSDQKDLLQLTWIKSNWQTSFFDEQAIQVGLNLVGTLNSDRKSSLKAGSQPGMRGIPRKGVWAKAYGTFSLDYQIPLLISDNGTWTLAPFMDTGYIRQESGEESINYTAYGIGTYYYLKQIAIPGMGFYVGTNDTYQDSFFKFTIGFSF